jgi:hypothetical protein
LDKIKPKNSGNKLAVFLRRQNYAGFLKHIYIIRVKKRYFSLEK